MPPADRSQTERIRRLRAQVQAVRRNECLTCPELGPQGPTTESIWLSRRFGQMTYRRETDSGAIVVQSCCTTTPNLTCINLRVACDGNPITGLNKDNCYTITNTGNSDVYVKLGDTRGFSILILLQPGSTSGAILGIDSVGPAPCTFTYTCRLTTGATCGSSGPANDCIKNSEAKTISLTVIGDPNSTPGEILVQLSPGSSVYGLPDLSTYSVAAC